MSDLTENDKKSELIPGNNEVLKNRVFGMPTSKMTRHQRVSFTAMVKIAYDTLSKDVNKRVFEYDTKEFMNMIGIKKERKQSHLFTQVFIDEDGWEQESEEYSLEKTLRKLIEKTIIFRFKDDNGKAYKVEATALLAYFKLTKEKVTFEFSEWIRSKILTTNNAYIMKIPIIASFKSGYTVTLFEQLEQRRDFRRWEVSVNVLRKIFGLDDEKYKRFNNFKTRVLEVAKEEINKKTSYTVWYELIKSGKKVDKIIFSWSINKNSFLEFKELIRSKFINIPLIVMEGEDGEHLIQVSKDGKLYNAKNPDMFYPTKRAEAIWKVMFENQEKMLIKEQAENINSFKESDFTKYYGKDVVFDSEMYKNIVQIAPTSLKNKLKIKFHSGDMIVMTEEEFLKCLIIRKIEPSEK